MSCFHVACAVHARRAVRAPTRIHARPSLEVEGTFANSFANSWRAGVSPTHGLRLEPSRRDAAGSATHVQISSTTVSPESKAAMIVSNDRANAVSKASFLQFPSRTHRNHSAAPGWLVR